MHLRNDTMMKQKFEARDDGDWSVGSRSLGDSLNTEKNKQSRVVALQF